MSPGAKAVPFQGNRFIPSLQDGVELVEFRPRVSPGAILTLSLRERLRRGSDHFATQRGRADFKTVRGRARSRPISGAAFSGGGADQVEFV